MRGRRVFLAAVYALFQLQIAGCFSGDHERFVPAHHRWPFLERSLDQGAGARHRGPFLERSLDQGAGARHRGPFHSLSLAREGRLRPPAVLRSHFRRAPGAQGVSLLARPDHQVEVENAPVSAKHIVTVALQLDIRKLNMSLLRAFRDGVAAALDVSPRLVHINRLNEQKNGIELYVSSDRPGASEPIRAEEVIRSLNVNVLHGSLGSLGVTEVSPEKNVLQGQYERDNVWTKEGFYAVVIFLTIFIIIVTCLMVLYRLKEKVESPDRQLKEPPGQDVHLAPVPVQTPPVPLGPSMVQAAPAPKPASTCVPPVKPCASPFRMKPAAGLQERRGSNVSLVLDMSALGAVEPLSCVVATPRERAAMEYLHTAGRTLSRQQLRDTVLNTQRLHAQFVEIPMNFVDPKELDIPSHGTKNRYKTILPNPHSRVILRTKNTYDPLGSYINANYVRGYLGDEKTYIATQGPMINTVNDFWQMAWQEDCPVIVMITKLKEKNEKCVLYWPEKRGIYGKVEVLVNSVRECEHYTVRNLTLKQAGQSRSVKHYWYTSWPDHKTPDSAQPLLQLMAEVEEDRLGSGPRGPVVVHCSAGIGRTGCFIATTIGCRQLQREGAVDVLGIVCQLRADRGGMIQTGEQYEFVHHALSLFESRLSAEAGQ
ncbi:receptor-type tyrosine-protein phosphatase R isoform X1 [Conger conger]|uniref:receptor-type tyrosine-protein phosphatase R isoform X1 n=1 Tax=Conger conger TaxID=82655 RepID=UPI002A5A02E1|nr:receptor-type tyrosine-protein phosphatase R isoform X1 [Conger conger]